MTKTAHIHDLFHEVHREVTTMNERRFLRRCVSCTGTEIASSITKDIFRAGCQTRTFHKSRRKDENIDDFASKMVDSARLLGSGGFGTVYHAEINGNKVAVKRMHRNRRNPLAMFESIQAEKLAMSLHHPNIVETFAILENQDISQALIIMQFAGERNLQSVIDNERENLEMSRRLKFATDITRALEFIHSNNLAHLDLKPANIIVDVYDTCRLADFGCCQLVTSGNNEQECLPPSPTPSPPSTTRSSLTGTFAYRAPELLKGEEPTTKSDMYSLGICLWQMLTREQPYGLESQFVVIFGVVANQMRPSLVQVASHDIPTYAYIELMTSLWQAEPERRPDACSTLSSLITVKTLCKTLSHS